MILDAILFLFLVLTALWSIMSSDLLKGAIALAITSIVIALTMFRFDAPIAAVLELSVCAGLITVVFISAISLTRPLNETGVKERRKYHFKRYWVLPILAFVGALIVWRFAINNPDLFKINTTPVFGVSENTFRSVFWNERIIDIFGQIIVIMAGIFGVVVLFKRLYESKEANK